jgi:general secretion pathway protein C
MSTRLLSMLVWALVAASAVYWGLRLFTRSTLVPGGAVVASAQVPADGDLTRLLGSPAAKPVAEIVAADSRFQLLGVVAPRHGQVNGLALVAVDGKPARTVLVGGEVEPGLRLLAVSQREAEFGPVRGSPTLKLVLPMLAEANRGRPGDPAPGSMPMGGLRPGMPQAAQSNQSFRIAPGMVQQQPPQAGPEQSNDSPADGGTPAVMR